MMRTVLTTALMALVMKSPALAAAPVTTVEVFANSATLVRPPVQPPAYLLKVFRLDAMAQIGEQISAGLPPTEAAARAYMQQHQAQIKQRYKEQIVNAANGMSLAVHYRLDRLPAVVINRRSVIYGVADVDQAVGLYLQSKGARR